MDSVQIIEDETLYKGFIKVTKRHLDVNGQKVSRTVGSFKKDAVMVIAIDTQGNLIFNHELAGPKVGFINTLVKGAKDEGRSDAQVAVSELTEEVGYKAAAIQVLCRFDDRPTHLTTVTTVVLATGCTPTNKQGGDEEEGTIHLRRKPLAEVLLDPLSTFSCARCVAALFELKAQMENGLVTL